MIGNHRRTLRQLHRWAAGTVSQRQSRLNKSRPWLVDQIRRELLLQGPRMARVALAQQHPSSQFNYPIPPHPFLCSSAPFSATPLLKQTWKSLSSCSDSSHTPIRSSSCCATIALGTGKIEQRCDKASSITMRMCEKWCQRSGCWSITLATDGSRCASSLGRTCLKSLIRISTRETIRIICIWRCFGGVASLWLGKRSCGARLLSRLESRFGCIGVAD